MDKNNIRLNSIGIFIGHYLWMNLIVWLFLVGLNKLGFHINIKSLDAPILLFSAYLTSKSNLKRNRLFFTSLDIINISLFISLVLAIIGILYSIGIYKVWNWKVITSALFVSFPIYFILVGFSFFLSNKYLGKSNQTSLDDHTYAAKEAYMKRDYENAYKLFCEAEKIGKLDELSLQFKVKAKNRIE
jgi:hypothetical protein